MRLQINFGNESELKWDGFFILSLVFSLAAFSFGYKLAIDNASKPIQEIVCDHPDWQDSGFATISAECKINSLDGATVKVTILD